MKRFMLSIIMMVAASAACMAQDTIWVKYTNRFLDNGIVNAVGADSILFSHNRIKVFVPSLRTGYRMYYYNKLLDGDTLAQFMFDDPGRILYKSYSLSGSDFFNENSQWCFKRSKESEHYVVFWEKEFGDNPKTNSGLKFDPDYILSIGELCWKKYVQLGFITPGDSKTDKYKIIMLVYYTSDWVANGSGENEMVGLFNVSPWAVTSRGGATVAHEIGHTFQYLVSTDLGQSHGFNYGYGDNASGGNGFWESCANWQAYKVYPSMQFSDGENYEGHLNYHHLNLLHEDWRYQNCFVQDYWVWKHGKDFIGRLWRESIKPEDPLEAYMRLCDLTIDEFNDEQYEGCARMATWDINGVRDYAKNRINDRKQPLSKNDDGWWQVSSNYCPQNYGYNVINLNNVTKGTEVKVHFKGIAGEDGYRKVKVAKAGWRYGFVAYAENTARYYSEIGKDADGTLSFTVPANTKFLYLVVMGAPTEYWRHPWDGDTSNDEQWPYKVWFEGTNIYGQFAEYPDDYVLSDTTVTINAELAYNSGSYTSTRVQYDMGAVSKALGLTTDEMKAVTKTTTSPRFVGVDANGTIHTGTTTSTSSSTCYGHWFNASGNVCNYDGTARIFAEMYPDSYGCYVGQYPGRLTVGKTYTIRQAIQRQKDGKWYTATMVVNLTITN